MDFYNPLASGRLALLVSCMDGWNGSGLGWAPGRSPQALDGCPWDGRGLQVDIHVSYGAHLGSKKVLFGRFTKKIPNWLVDPP